MLPARQHFPATFKKHFGILPQQVDFDDEKTLHDINQWVEDAAHQKMKKFLPNGSLTDLTRMVLVNAIYFKGNWLYQFEKSHQLKPFYLGFKD